MSDVIVGLEAAAYEVPTDQPEADGTAEWSATTAVVVQVTAGGEAGMGWTYATAACKRFVDDVLAPLVVGCEPMNISGLWESMVRGCRNYGRPGLVSCSIAAVDTALWDLKARLLGLPLCTLLGQVHETVPVYGSGGFTTYDDETLRRQVEHWVEDYAIPRVKIKIAESRGHNIGRDIARVAFTREVAGADSDVYVDANGGYDRGSAVRVARQLEQLGVTWFEEPVSSDDLVGLRAVRTQVDPDVAAGEYAYDLTYVERMCAAGAVDCLQLDITRCGGLTEWMRGAAVAAAHHLDVSAHCAPSLHVHPASAIPNLRHLEYFHDHVRLESLLFEGALTPTNGALRPHLDSAGHGLALRREEADQFRVA